MDSMDHKDKKPIKFVKRQDPEHPYCTNWPMSEEMNEIEICVSCGAETSYKKGDDVTYDHDKVWSTVKERISVMPCWIKYKNYTNTNDLPKFVRETEYA